MSFLSGVGNWLRKELLPPANSPTNGAQIGLSSPAPKPAPNVQPQQPQGPQLRVNTAPNMQSIRMPNGQMSNYTAPPPPQASQPQQNLWQRASNLPVIHPLLHADQKILQTGENIGKGLVSGGEGIVKTAIIAPAVQTIADVRGNPYEKQAAQQYTDQSQAQASPLIHGITRTVPEVYGTVRHPFSQNTYHPNTPIEQALFGNTPVQNIQAKVATNYDAHGNLNPVVRAGLAGAEGAGSVVQDLSVLHPAIRGTVKAASSGTEAGSKIATSLAQHTDQAATNFAINHPSTQAMLQHLDQQKVMYDNAPNQMVRDRMNRSITANTAALRDNITGLKNNFHQGGYVKIPGGAEEPGGYELPPPSDELIQSVAHEYPSTEQFVKDTAQGAYQIDKSMTGGQMRKVDELGGAGQYIRTSEHTPFYRDYFAANKRAPSQKVYEEAIRQELESGSGKLVSNEEHQIYQLIKDREQGNQAIMQSPEAQAPKDANGNPMLVQDITPKRIKINQRQTTPKQLMVVNERDITPGDKVMANTTGVSPVQAAEQRLAQMHEQAHAGTLPGEPPQVPSVGEILQTFPGAQRIKYNVDRTKLSGKGLSMPNREIGMNDPDTYAKTFGVTRLQAEKDLRDMKLGASNVRHLSADEIRQMSPAERLTIRQRREIIANNPEQHATANQVSLHVEEGSPVKVALAKALGANDERMARFGQAEKLGYKLSKHDQDLLYRYDDGESLEALAKEADKPTVFTKAANAATDALDYSLALDRAAGGSTLRQSSYLPHYYEASQEWLDAHKIPEDQRIKRGKEYAGFRDDSAKYKSYMDAQRTVGLKPLYKSPVEAIQKYAESGDRMIRNQSLLTSLAHAVPDEIGDLNTVVGPNRTPFRPAAGGNLPFSASERVDSHLKAFQRAWEPSSRGGKIVLKTGLGAVRGAKRSLFFLTPFHYANETARFLGTTWEHPGIAGRGMAEAIFSQPGGYGKVLDAANKDGTMDWIRKSGTPFKDIQVKAPAGSLKTAGRKINIVGKSNQKLTEFGNALIIALARAAKTKGIVPDSPEGVALGAEYGKVIGFINEGVAGISPNVSRAFSAGALAPYWLRTTLGLVKDAVESSVVPGRITGKHGIGLYNPGDVARGATIGTKAFWGALAIIGSYVASGHLPTMHQAFNEAGLNPNNPVPNIEGKSKNAKGEGQVINFPTDPLGMAEMAVTDPQHFASSRYSPFAASAVDIATNRNWNGQPLVDPNDPNALVKRIAIGSKNMLPISLQNATNPNLSIKQGLVQDIGGRYKTNPEDPQVQANKQYFDGLKTEANALKNSTDGYGQYWAQQFANLHPSNTTDASGNKYPTPYNPVSSGAKYAAYTAVDANGNQVLSPVFYADQRLANLTPNYPSSPLYKLQGNGTDVAGAQSPKALVAMQYQHAQLPQQKAVIMAANGGQNGWLGQYENAVGDYSKNYQSNLTDYFHTLGWSQQAVDQYWQHHPSTPDPIDQVNFDQNTTNLLNQYYQLTGSGNSTAASQFFSQHADVLGPAFDQTAQHANALRAAKGELQLQGYPPESDHVKQILDSMPSGSDKASKKARALLINGNSDVSQYLANISLYEATSKGTQLIFKNPADMSETQGQLANSTPAGQSFLKSAYALGNYDIGLNPVTGLYDFMQNGTTAPGSQTSFAQGAAYSASHRKKPYVYHHKLPKIYTFHSKHQRKVTLRQPKSLNKIKLAQKQSHVKFIAV